MNKSSWTLWIVKTNDYEEGHLISSTTSGEGKKNKEPHNRTYVIVIMKPLSCPNVRSSVGGVYKHQTNKEAIDLVF